MTDKIRVVMLAQSFHRTSYGGAERQIASLAPYLVDKQNIDLHVIARRNNNLPKHEIIDNVNVHRTPTLPVSALTTLLYILFTQRILASLKPQLVHAHGLFSTSSAGMLAKYLFGVPVVAKVLRGGLFGDVIRVRDKIFGEQRMQIIARNIDGFAVISNEIDQELEDNGVPSAKRYFIPNGVDTDRFKPVSDAEKERQRTNLGVETDAFVAVYVGRLVPEKRVDLLLKAWQTIESTHPEARLYILGQGKERDHLEAIASDSVQFVGMVKNVEQWLQIADLYILPSVSEGLSNSLLEAMASALPIIATSVGDAPQLLMSKQGWCIEPDNINALKNALQAALANQDKLRNMGEVSRQRILAEYQLSATAAKLRNLYDEVIEAKE